MSSNTRSARRGRAGTSSMNYDHLVKLILIGDEGTGKSSLMTRFCDQHFSHSYVATIGVDFKIRTVEADVDGGAPAVVKMQMWDTAGQERFNSITKSFYRGAHVLVVVYDVTNRESFTHVTRWLSGCLDVIGADIPTCLIGNKSDLERIRQVDTEEGETFASNHNMHFTETSAKEGDNVAGVFLEMASRYVRKAREESAWKASASTGGGAVGPAARGRTIKPTGSAGCGGDDDGGSEGSCWESLFAGFKRLFKQQQQRPPSTATYPKSSRRSSRNASYPSTMSRRVVGGSVSGDSCSLVSAAS